MITKILRLAQAHKYTYGHLLIIGGLSPMGGAVILAAKAAYRTGVGVVSTATAPQHCGSILSQCPEVIPHPVSSPSELVALLSKKTALIIGPGLGPTQDHLGYLQIAFGSTLPKVIDADALTLLSQNILPLKGSTILTPHEGEAARLLGISVEKCHTDRITTVSALCEKYNATIILKGPRTLIQTPGATPIECVGGSPGMATAGTGDVLSGIVGALLAQGLSAIDAALLGVTLHNRAGELAAEEMGEISMMATDVIDNISLVIHSQCAS